MWKTSLCGKSFPFSKTLPCVGGSAALTWSATNSWDLVDRSVRTLRTRSFCSSLGQSESSRPLHTLKVNLITLIKPVQTKTQRTKNIYSNAFIWYFCFKFVILHRNIIMLNNDSTSHFMIQSSQQVWSTAEMSNLLESSLWRVHRLWGRAQRAKLDWLAKPTGEPNEPNRTGQIWRRRRNQTGGVIETRTH